MILKQRLSQKYKKTDIGLLKTNHTLVTFLFRKPQIHIFLRPNIFYFVTILIFFLHLFVTELAKICRLLNTRCLQLIWQLIQHLALMAVVLFLSILLKEGNDFIFVLYLWTESCCISNIANIIKQLMSLPKSKSVQHSVKSSPKDHMREFSCS